MGHLLWPFLFSYPPQPLKTNLLRNAKGFGGDNTIHIVDFVERNLLWLKKYKTKGKGAAGTYREFLRVVLCVSVGASRLFTISKSF